PDQKDPAVLGAAGDDSTRVESSRRLPRAASAPHAFYKAAGDDLPTTTSGSARIIPRMRALRIRPPDVEERLPRFDTANILWYLGAIATAFASNAVVAAVHSSARGIWILLVSLAFA